MYYYPQKTVVYLVPFLCFLIQPFLPLFLFFLFFGLHFFCSLFLFPKRNNNRTYSYVHPNLLHVQWLSLGSEWVCHQISLFPLFFLPFSLETKPVWPWLRFPFHPLSFFPVLFTPQIGPLSLCLCFHFLLILLLWNSVQILEQYSTSSINRGSASLSSSSSSSLSVH